MSRGCIHQRGVRDGRLKEGEWGSYRGGERESILLLILPLLLYERLLKWHEEDERTHRGNSKVVATRGPGVVGGGWTIVLNILIINNIIRKWHIYKCKTHLLRKKSISKYEVRTTVEVRNYYNNDYTIHFWPYLRIPLSTKTTRFIMFDNSPCPHPRVVAWTGSWNSNPYHFRLDGGTRG